MTLHDYYHDLNEVRVKFRESLDDFPEDGVCSCGRNDGDKWFNYELGYSRYSKVELPGGKRLTILLDGWDDMSESGDLNLMVCERCDKAHPVPDWETDYE